MLTGLAALSSPSFAQSVYYDDSSPNLVRIGNVSFYEIGLRKTNGAILYVSDKSTGQRFTLVAHPTVTGWQTFSELFTQTYTKITALSTKPLMVAETASAEQGGSKANWIADAYSTQIPGNFAKIKAIIWFNENKETDWRIESSTAAQNAFAIAMQSSFYATNEYASMSNSPISIPK